MWAVSTKRYSINTTSPTVVRRFCTWILQESIYFRPDGNKRFHAVWNSRGIWVNPYSSTYHGEGCGAGMGQVKNNWYHVCLVVLCKTGLLLKNFRLCCAWECDISHSIIACLPAIDWSFVCHPPYQHTLNKTVQDFWILKHKIFDCFSSPQI